MRLKKDSLTKGAVKPFVRPLEIKELDLSVENEDIFLAKSKPATKSRT